MAELKKLYIYDIGNDFYFDSPARIPGAVLTISIELFDRTPGCSCGLGVELLTEENIGKKFDISILDPVIIGAVEFVGIGQKYIPDSIYKEVTDSFKDFFDCANFATFKQGDEYIIVDIDFLDVEPLF